MTVWTQANIAASSNSPQIERSKESLNRQIASSGPKACPLRGSYQVETLWRIHLAAPDLVVRLVFNSSDYSRKFAAAFGDNVSGRILDSAELKKEFEHRSCTNAPDSIKTLLKWLSMQERRKSPILGPGEDFKSRMSMSGLFPKLRGRSLLEEFWWMGHNFLGAALWCLRNCRFIIRIFAERIRF